MLNAYVFESIEQVQQITEDWFVESDEQRPHGSLGRVPLLTYLASATAASDSSVRLTT